MKTNSLDQICAELKKSNFIVVFDEHRECEADLFLLAEYVTPKKINFLLQNSRGMICVACESDILDRLQIPLMVKKNNNPHGTNFCVSVDAAEGISTGVSASDRAQTIQLLVDPHSKNDDFVIPGHTFPLRAEKDYQKRFGHTEAAIFLAEKCEATPTVVICEILNEKGRKACKTEVSEFSKKYGLKITTLEAIKKLSSKF